MPRNSAGGCKCADMVHKEAGIKDPRTEISMSEVHDCFSITEFVTMEDLQLSPKGGAYDDIMSGRFDLNGESPCQVEGGLKCFEHPIGASGMRMIYAMYEQLLERVPEERQVKNARMGLTHNLGGWPHANVCAVSVIGRDERVSTGHPQTAGEPFPAGLASLLLLMSCVKKILIKKSKKILQA